MLTTTQAIEKVIRDLGGQRVRISELRRLMPWFTRVEMDEALNELQRAGSIVMYPLDDPQEITKADEAAAISVAGVGKRHIVYAI